MIIFRFRGKGKIWMWDLVIVTFDAFRNGNCGVLPCYATSSASKTFLSCSLGLFSYLLIF